MQKKKWKSVLKFIGILIIAFSLLVPMLLPLLDGGFY